MSILNNKKVILDILAFAIMPKEEVTKKIGSNLMIAAIFSVIAALGVFTLVLYLNFILFVELQLLNFSDSEALLICMLSMLVVTIASVFACKHYIKKVGCVKQNIVKQKQANPENVLESFLRGFNSGSHRR